VRRDVIVVGTGGRQVLGGVEQQVDDVGVGGDVGGALVQSVGETRVGAVA